MANVVPAENIQQEQGRSGEGLFSCLRKIKKEEDERKDPKEIDIDKEKRRNAEDKLADDLLEALEKNDAPAVWELVENNHPIVALKNLHQDCKDVAEKEKNKEKGYNYNCTPRPISFSVDTYSPSPDVDEQQRADKEQKNDARKRKWIKILSNPLFIGVEWLWRTNSNCQCEDCQKNKNKDVIEGALEDAHLLDEIASYEHYYSLDEYKAAVEAYETFATDVLEESTLSELYEIMDIEGDGFLLQGKPQRLNKLDRSLSLLKIAANKGRKKFVASPRSQLILDEIVFYKWPDWQDKSTMRRILWFIFQFILTTIITPFYIPLRIFDKMFPNKSSNMCSNRCAKTCIEKIKSLYEHPYSKFVNHTMSYIIFLSLLLLSTFGFENQYKSTSSGLTRIDFAVIIFVAGLSLQEILGAYKEGIRFYFSKWWNIMHILTLVTFVVSYMVWLAAWIIYGEWKPRRNPFTVADVLYASGMVMGYFHFTYVFQINSTLGPLQLSLYRMLKDVLRFLVIFFMLFIAFGAGVVKVYSYYVSSQYKLQGAVNGTQASHDVARHELTLVWLVWLLLGEVDSKQLEVADPAFTLTTVFGRIFFVAYGICTTLVAINMLIAMMNNSYERIMEDANKEWKFSRSRLWLDYINEGNFVPVPFNIAYYSLFLFYIPYYIFCVCCRKEKWSRYRTSQTRIDLELEQMNVEQDNGNKAQAREDATPIKRDVELSRVDQTSAHCCTCICSTWCCFPYTCQFGPMKSGAAGETSTHCFTCICPGCSCFCKPTKARTVREERIQAMKFSVARYLNNQYLNGEFEGETSALASLLEPQADEGAKE